MNKEDNVMLTKCKVVIKIVNGVIICLGPNIKFLCCIFDTFNFLDNYPTSFCSPWGL